MKIKLIFPIIVFCIVSFIGCGPKASLSGLAPCQGKVTLDGSPVSEANVMFAPKGGGRAATAKTNAQGEFIVGTLLPKDGIMPGEYAVVVTKLEPSGPAPKPFVNADGDTITPAPPEENVLPKQYESTDKTELNISIPAAGNKNLLLELKK